MGVAKVGASEVSAISAIGVIGDREVIPSAGAREVGVTEVGAREVGASEVSATEVGVWVNVSCGDVIAVGDHKIILCHTSILTDGLVMKHRKLTIQQLNTTFSGKRIDWKACAFSLVFV